MITRHLKVHNKNRLSLSFDAGEKSNNELMAANSAGGITSASAASLSSLTPKLAYQNSLSSFSNQMANFPSLLPSNTASIGGQDSRFTQDLRKYDIKSKSTCSLSTL